MKSTRRVLLMTVCMVCVPVFLGGSLLHADDATQSNESEKAGLSWRVHLLPFLGKQNLYDEFHLDEPWNSPHNKKLIDKMPRIYRSDPTLPEGKTTFVALISPHSAITGSQEIKFADITDGASQTIMCVKANREFAVTWTKPGDIQFDPDNPFRGLGDSGVILALFCDGSVHKIPTTISEETMRRLVNRHDGEVVSLDF